jgi:hypothetical protein
MAYIGKQPVIGNFQVCDAITVVDAQAAYTMQVGGVDVSPESANHMLVSLNGILQAPTTSYTVSGSTITFASALETGDVIDFIQILGNVLDLGVPSDNTVSTAKIVDANVTTAKMFSGFANGITEADQWRLTANVTLTNPAEFVTSNWERNDNSGYGGIGTGMTESSGVFSFPSTGIYLIQSHASFQQSGGTSDENALFTYSTINNSSYTQQTSNLSAGATGTDHNNASSSFLFDVTDVSNCKVKFEQYGFNAILRGSSTQNRTHITFIRLGDT